jgi:hypothetical protein
VHSSTLLDAFISVFEIVWRRALPLHLPLEGTPLPPDAPRR